MAASKIFLSKILSKNDPGRRREDFATKFSRFFFGNANICSATQKFSKNCSWFLLKMSLNDSKVPMELSYSKTKLKKEFEKYYLQCTCGYKKVTKTIAEVRCRLEKCDLVCLLLILRGVKPLKPNVFIPKLARLKECAFVAIFD